MGKTIGLRKATDLLHLPGHFLMKMHTTGSPDGFAFYIVPGGYVEPDTAAKILQRPDIVSNHDGLFPGVEQSWKICA